MARVADKFYLSLGVEVVAVLGTGSPVRGWMGSCLGLGLTNETVERARNLKVVPLATQEKLLYAPFLHDLVRDGRAAPGPNSAAAAAVACLEVGVVGPHLESREAAVVEVRLRTRRSAATSSFYKEWTTSRGA